MVKKKEICSFHSEIRIKFSVKEQIIHILISIPAFKGNFLNAYLRTLHFNFGWK